MSDAHGTSRRRAGRPAAPPPGAEPARSGGEPRARLGDRRGRTSSSTSSAQHLRTEELVFNMGPQHPSTHGVLRVVIKTDGEVVHGAPAARREPAPLRREDRRVASRTTSGSRTSTGWTTSRR